MLWLKLEEFAVVIEINPVSDTFKGRDKWKGNAFDDYDV